MNIYIYIYIQAVSIIELETSSKVQEVGSCSNMEWDYSGLMFFTLVRGWQIVLPPISEPSHSFSLVMWRVILGTGGKSFTCKTACSFKVKMDGDLLKWLMEKYFLGNVMSRLKHEHMQCYLNESFRFTFCEAIGWQKLFFLACSCLAFWHDNEQHRGIDRPRTSSGD